MIPTEVANIAGSLRKLVPILGFDRSVRWAWVIYEGLIADGWSFRLESRK